MMSMPRLLADSAPRSNPSLESLTRADEHTHGCPLLTQSGHGSLQMDPSSTIARVERLGATTGQNVKMEYRWAAGHDERLPAMAVELVNRPVAVLLTGSGLWATISAKAATATIPIVFTTASDPVELGYVASLNRPSGNVTGVIGSRG